jgi:hypothetical protein
MQRKVWSTVAASAIAAAAGVALSSAPFAAPPADTPAAATQGMGHPGMSMGDHAMGGQGGSMQDMQHDGKMSEMMQQHHQMMAHMQQMHGGMLTMPGQDAFGAIQEVVRALEADPETDWAKVDLEALRQHLIDMNDVTLQATAATKPIDDGVEIAVTGSGRTLAAIQRMVPAHAAEINGLHGWSVKSASLTDGVLLTVTSSDPKEIQHIRGLGFIGILVIGSHHQPHHMAMAKGEFPHGH